MSGVPRDTYKQYKEDTLAFTTWLSQVAKSCGWKPLSKPQTSTATTDSPAAAEKGPRLKGKERKLAREAAKSAPPKPDAVPPRATVKYEITTKELLDQVEIVAQAKKHKARCPEGVQKVLERAIDLRKRCAAWFRETDFRQKYAESNKGHQHFIDVLEKAAWILGETTRRDTTDSPPEPSDKPLKEVDVLK